MSSLDRILPFLRPIEDLLVDPTVTEVMVNGGGRRIFVERAGMVEAVPDRTIEVRNLTVAIKNIARAAAMRSPTTSRCSTPARGRLARGRDVPAMFGGRTDAHRAEVHASLLVGRARVGRDADAGVGATLQRAVVDRRNILISGGTGTGKTTLLNALAATIPASDRIVLIEETSEILIDKPNPSGSRRAVHRRRSARKRRSRP